MSFLGCFELFFSSKSDNFGMTKEEYCQRKYFRKISEKHRYFQLVKKGDYTLMQCTLCVENFVCAKQNVVAHLESKSHNECKQLRIQQAVLENMTDCEFKCFVENNLSESGFCSQRIKEILPFVFSQSGRPPYFFESTDDKYLNKSRSSSTLDGSTNELFLESEIYESTLSLSILPSTKVTLISDSNNEVVAQMFKNQDNIRKTLEFSAFNKLSFRNNVFTQLYTFKNMI